MTSCYNSRRLCNTFPTVPLVSAAGNYNLYNCTSVPPYQNVCSSDETDSTNTTNTTNTTNYMNDLAEVRDEIRLLQAQVRDEMMALRDEIKTMCQDMQNMKLQLQQEATTRAKASLDQHDTEMDMILTQLVKQKHEIINEANDNLHKEVAKLEDQSGKQSESIACL